MLHLAVNFLNFLYGWYFLLQPLFLKVIGSSGIPDLSILLFLTVTSIFPGFLSTDVYRRFSAKPNLGQLLHINRPRSFVKVLRCAFCVLVYIIRQILPFSILFLFCCLEHVTLNFFITSVMIPLFFCSSVRSSVGVTVSSSN